MNFSYHDTHATYVVPSWWTRTSTRCNDDLEIFVSTPISVVMTNQQTFIGPYLAAFETRGAVATPFAGGRAVRVGDYHYQGVSRPVWRMPHGHRSAPPPRVTV